MPLRFVKESVIPATVAEVFAFHERPDALELLQPPWDRTEVLQLPASLEVGTQVRIRAKIGPFWTSIVAEHVAYEKNVSFEDHMLEGPFAMWQHQHLFFEHAEGCRLRDDIQYEPPLGLLGRIAEPFAIRGRLRRLFDYRHEVTRREVLAGSSSGVS